MAGSKSSVQSLCLVSWRKPRVYKLWNERCLEVSIVFVKMLKAAAVNSENVSGIKAITPG